MACFSLVVFPLCVFGRKQNKIHGRHAAAVFIANQMGSSLFARVRIRSNYSHRPCGRCAQLGPIAAHLMTNRWGGDKGWPVDASTNRTLKNHLADGRRAFIGKRTAFEAISAPGVKRPSPTKTGAILEVHVEWRTAPALSE